MEKGFKYSTDRYVSYMPKWLSHCKLPSKEESVTAYKLPNIQVLSL